MRILPSIRKRFVNGYSVFSARANIRVFKDPSGRGSNLLNIGMMTAGIIVTMKSEKTSIKAQA